MDAIIYIQNLIYLYVYPYIMPKQKITISLDSEIAGKLRLLSMKRYGNSRSMSRLIEHLVITAMEAENEDTH
jgi:metal-responsive CopG/Arc/MetJ family transcriptional regulator